MFRPNKKKVAGQVVPCRSWIRLFLVRVRLGPWMIEIDDDWVMRSFSVSPFGP